MKYFAYGSNMLEERLKAPGRVPGAVFLDIGRTCGYRIRFHKKSSDESGKCNIVKTLSASDIVYGVIFEIPDEQVESLDSAEGCGHGYHHDCNIPIKRSDNSEVQVLTYIADPDAIDESLIPYDWYYRLVIAGAEQHRLLNDYIGGLKAFPHRADTVKNRASKLEAEAALDAYNRNIHT